MSLTCFCPFIGPSLVGFAVVVAVVVVVLVLVLVVVVVVVVVVALLLLLFLRFSSSCSRCSVLGDNRACGCGSSIV